MAVSRTPTGGGLKPAWAVSGHGSGLSLAVKTRQVLFFYLYFSVASRGAGGGLFELFLSSSRASSAVRPVRVCVRSVRASVMSRSLVAVEAQSPLSVVDLASGGSISKPCNKEIGTPVFRKSNTLELALRRQRLGQLQAFATPRSAASTADTPTTSPAPPRSQTFCNPASTPRVRGQNRSTPCTNAPRTSKSVRKTANNLGGSKSAGPSPCHARGGLVCGLSTPSRRRASSECADVTGSDSEPAEARSRAGSGDSLDLPLSEFFTPTRSSDAPAPAKRTVAPTLHSTVERMQNETPRVRKASPRRKSMADVAAMATAAADMLSSMDEEEHDDHNSHFLQTPDNTLRSIGAALAHRAGGKSVSRHQRSSSCKQSDLQGVAESILVSSHAAVFENPKTEFTCVKQFRKPKPMDLTPLLQNKVRQQLDLGPSPTAARGKGHRTRGTGPEHSPDATSDVFINRVSVASLVPTPTSSPRSSSNTASPRSRSGRRRLSAEPCKSDNSESKSGFGESKVNGVAAPKSPSPSVSPTNHNPRRRRLHSDFARVQSSHRMHNKIGNAEHNSTRREAKVTESKIAV